jgi:hypothetical protein
VTCLFGLLGDAYNEVEMTIIERLPGLAFCIRRVNSELVFQDFEGDWGYLTSGFDTSAEGLEAIRAQISHKILGKDAPTGIPSAEEKNLEPLGGSFHRRKQTTGTYQDQRVVSAKTASGTAIQITEGTLRIDHYDDNYLTLPPVRAANKERTSLTDSGLGFNHLVGPLQEQYSDQIFAIGGPG